MKHQNFLFVSSVIFGITVFTGIFLFAPSPFSFNLPIVQRAFLPMSGERTIAAPEPKTVELMFVGDIMLSRSVERTIVEKGSTWPFAHLNDLFNEADLVIGNLEGTVRSEPRYEVVNELNFDTTPDNLKILHEAGFTHVSLANNHSDDFGQKVTDETRQFVTEAELIPFGDPNISEDFVAREIVNGMRISFVGFHAFGDSLNDVAATVESEKQIGQFVIVYPHWGPEYQYQPGSAQVEAAEKFVKAGADLVIGAHPHVIQTVEIIDGVPVIYSLGNFLFDQDFSAETMLGLTARIIISEDAIDIAFVPVKIVGRQTIPLYGEEATQALSKLELASDGLSVPRQ